MAFLSHSIPWSGLSALFEYRAAKSGPGPQEASITAKAAGNRTKQLEYFALRFQSVIREHAATERGRYLPAGRYIARAKTWKESQTPEHGTIPDFSTADPETRLVFPPDFASLYMSYVPITSGHAYGRQGLVEEFADIETWIDFSKRVKDRWAEPIGTSEDERNRIWLDEKSCSDIVRLLIIDAATTNDAQRRHEMLETVFLLIHHPDKVLHHVWSSGMACCNIEVGIKRLVTETTSVFLFLNVLWTLVESTGAVESPLLHLCDAMEPPQSRDYDIVTLLPRPAYMNTDNFGMMLYSATGEHGHCVETVLFNPLLTPYEDGRRSRYHKVNSDGRAQSPKRHERDVLSDHAALKGALKSMWKVLVYCDMLFTESGQKINWEFAAMDAVRSLFGGKAGISRILGEDWTSYEARRMYDEGWRFYSMSEEEQKEFDKKRAENPE